MESKKKNTDKKETTSTPKDKAYVDTSDSKVVKGTDKAEVEKDKAVVENYSNEDNDILADFKKLAKDSKDVNDFMEKVREIKNVSQEVSDEFYSKYGDNGKLSIEEASKKLFDEVNSTNESDDFDFMKHNPDDFEDDDIRKYYDANVTRLNDGLSGKVVRFDNGKLKIEITEGEHKGKMFYAYPSEVKMIIEGVATEDDVVMDDDKDTDEKESSNAPDSPKATNEENETRIDNWEIKELTNGGIYNYGLYLDGFLVSALKTNEDSEVENKKTEVLKKIRMKPDIDDTKVTKEENEISTDDDEFDEDDTVNELTNEDKYNEVHRLLHLMDIKEGLNNLLKNFGLTDIEKIKESITEELTDDELNIVLEDVYKELEVEPKTELIEDESINESLRNDLGKKLF